MSSNPLEELRAFPGSFAETLAKGQGGTLFGQSPPDVLPTHPQAKKQAAGSQGKTTFRARYKQFDLTKEDQVAELESIMTDILNGRRFLRQERMANDKDGFTIVTLSWADLDESKPELPPPRVGKDGAPAKLQQQFPFPTIPDGAYPGSGTTLRPPGFDAEPDEAERAWRSSAVVTREEET